MSHESKQSFARVLTLALSATTGMWIFSYIALLFAGKTGGEVLFILGVLCLPFASRYSKSLGEGAQVGFVSAFINLLLIGSIVGGKAPVEMMSQGIIWSIGLFVSSMIFGMIGATFHSSIRNIRHKFDWRVGFLSVASILVFLMLVTGGLVTGMEAGLAVPDWPNSYGHNMLLYPLNEMIAPENEGVFFEHAHRLTGMFVGLTSLVMVIAVWIWSKKYSVRALAFTIFIFVCIQGLLGGLRVTGYLTFEQDREMLNPNLWIGVVHGVVGQLIFTGFVCLAAMFTEKWSLKEGTAGRGDLRWSLVLCASMVLQLILGAVYRHMMGDELLAPRATHVLYAHIAFALLVLVLAIVVGIRLMSRENRLLKNIGLTLHVLVLVQLLLGGGALLVIIISESASSIPSYELLTTTAHQANGALLLATSFLTMIWALPIKKQLGRNHD